MPKYDYVCKRCGNMEEHMHSIDECDTYIAYCLECGWPLTRVLGTPHVKGVNIFPAKIWNIPGEDTTVNNWGEYKKLLEKHNMDSPAMHD